MNFIVNFSWDINVFLYIYYFGFSLERFNKYAENVFGFDFKRCRIIARMTSQKLIFQKFRINGKSDFFIFIENKTCNAQ